MASYDAVVNLNVVGTSRLERVNAAIGQLNNLTRQLNNSLNLLAPGADNLTDKYGNLGDRLRIAFEPIKNFAREAANGTAKLANTVAGAAAQAQVFATALDNVKIKAGGLSAQEATVKNLSAAWIETTLNAQRYQKVQEQLQASQLAAKGLMQLGSGEIVRGTEAGVGVQGPRLPAALGGGMNLPPGETKLAPKMFQGIQGAFAKPGRAGLADALIGGAFPLLFGGGPGAALGGFAGGFAGGAIGGPLGMALSVTASAGGQKLDQAFAEALKRISEIDTATRDLNLDALRDSVIFVNKDLAVTVEQLRKAGEGDAARAAIAKEVTLQTGMLPEAVSDIANNSALLGNTWKEFLATVSGTLSIIATPFATALTVILQGLSKALQAVNFIATGVGGIFKRVVEIIARIPFLQPILKFIEERTKAILENNEQQYVVAVDLTNQLSKELTAQQQLYDIEKRRTLGNTIAEKAINASLDSQIAKNKINAEYAQKAADIRKKLAETKDPKATAELERALRQTEAARTLAIKNQEVNDKLVQQGLLLEANKQKYDSLVQSVQNQITRLELANQVVQSRFGAEAALNDLYGTQLQRQYELATTEKQRFDIAIKQFFQQIEAARIEYQQAKANNELLVKKAELEARITELKYKQAEADKAIAIAGAKSRGATPEDIRAISDAYDQGLGVQKEALDLAYDQVQAAAQIAENQNIVADAVYQTKVIQAESALAQKLVTDEIGLSKRAADELAGSLGAGVLSANELEINMAAVERAAIAAAGAIQRAINLQSQLQASGGGAATPPQQAAEGAYWPGGFKAFANGGMVSQPTLGLVGEGGEPEYIIPASKMNEAMARYASGQRGSSVIPNAATSEAGSYSAGTSSINPVVNVTTGPVMNMNNSNYVSQADFLAGLQVASRQGAQMALATLQGNNSMRRSVGIR